MFLNWFLCRYCPSHWDCIGSCIEWIGSHDVIIHSILHQCYFFRFFLFLSSFYMYFIGTFMLLSFLPLKFYWPSYWIYGIMLNSHLLTLIYAALLVIHWVLCSYFLFHAESWLELYVIVVDSRMNTQTHYSVVLHEFVCKMILLGLFLMDILIKHVRWDKIDLEWYFVMYW